jgi:copper chaperone CopZ
MSTLALWVLLTITGTSALAQAASSQPPGESTTQVCTLTVSGMTCAGCEAAVRMAARSVRGVTDATVSYSKGQAEVRYDPSKTTPRAIARAITERTGFRAEQAETTSKKKRE